MVRLSGNASTALPAMSVTVSSIVFVGQVTIISLFVIFFHCNINNSHVFWYNRINFINFHYVFVAGESAVEAYSCILHMFFFSFVVPNIYYQYYFFAGHWQILISGKLTYLFYLQYLLLFI